VARLALKTELFNNITVSGPVPILFASDQDAAFTGLMENSADTVGDLHKLSSRFLVMEHLSMDDAASYLLGPAKKAKGISAFPPPEILEQPSAKKRKTQAAPAPQTPASSSGKVFF